MPVSSADQKVCKYCSETAPVECLECGEWYCNNTTEGIAHIVYHMVRCRHRRVSAGGAVIKCRGCGEDNVFRLGSENKEVFCTACRDSHPLVYQKSLSLFPSVPSSMQRLEETSAGERSLPRVRLRYDAQTYIDTFVPLVMAESLKEKEIKESMRQENVSVRFDDGCCFFTFCRVNNDLKINIGDEIRFSHKSGFGFSGYVSDDQFTEELRVDIDLTSIIMPTDGSHGLVVHKSGIIPKGGVVPVDALAGFPKSGYTVEYVWRAVCYERMCWAMRRLYRDRKKSEVFKYILRGGQEKMGEIDILHPPSFCRLNESQQTAVKAALTRTLTLVQGPPGTGKTLVSAVIVYNAVKLLGKKVLVVAPSNTAVDQLALKINSAGLKVLRIMSRRREDGPSETDFLSLHNLIREFGASTARGDTDQEQIKHELIKAADVVCCTCVTAGQKLFNPYSFPFVLVDEAVQSTEPLTLIPCVYGATNLVLVGDHKQLGPTILNKDVVRAGFKQSLFERLLRIGVAPYLLTVQYRMNPELCQFPSEYFYGGLLKTGTAASRCMNFPCNFFYASNGKEEISQSGTSFINKAEALMVENIIRFLFKNGVLEQQIGVITPYEGQRAYILSKIFGNEPGNLEISNVDGFQGREKDFIIVSLVRSNSFQGIGFVADKRRMNVTLTRAKHGIAIVGNPFTLYKNEMWAKLLDWYEARGAIYEGPVDALKKMSLRAFDMKALADAV